MDSINIKKDQVLYVVLGDGRTIKPTKIVDVVKNCEKSMDPKRYLNIYTRYLDSKTPGTVTFYPEDFDRIVFYSEQDAKDAMDVKRVGRT